MCALMNTGGYVVCYLICSTDDVLALLVEEQPLNSISSHPLLFAEMVSLLHPPNHKSLISVSTTATHFFWVTLLIPLLCFRECLQLLCRKPRSINALLIVLFRPQLFSLLLILPDI